MIDTERVWKQVHPQWSVCDVTDRVKIQRLELDSGQFLYDVYWLKDDRWLCVGFALNSREQAFQRADEYVQKTAVV